MNKLFPLVWISKLTNQLPMTSIKISFKVYSKLESKKKHKIIITKINNKA